MAKRSSSEAIITSPNSCSPASTRGQPAWPRIPESASEPGPGKVGIDEHPVGPLTACPAGKAHSRGRRAGRCRDPHERDPAQPFGSARHQPRHKRIEPAGRRSRKAHCIPPATRNGRLPAAAKPGRPLARPAKGRQRTSRAGRRNCCCRRRRFDLPNDRLRIEQAAAVGRDPRGQARVKSAAVAATEFRTASSASAGGSAAGLADPTVSSACRWICSMLGSAALLAAVRVGASTQRSAQAVLPRSPDWSTRPDRSDAAQGRARIPHRSPQADGRALARRCRGADGRRP